MSEEVVLFWLCASLAVLSAVLTISARNPVRGAVALLACIVSISGIYLTLAAELLAVVQLLVYAGAVVVLFVFVIMLIGPTAQPPSDRTAVVSRVVSFVLVGALGVVIVPVLARVAMDRPEIPACAPGDAACVGFGSVEAMGRAIFGPALVPFELSGILLLVAIVGAIAVASGRHASKTSAEETSAETPRKSPVAVPVVHTSHHDPNADASESAPTHGAE